MNKNLNGIASELFDKIRSQFPRIKLGDEDSAVTSDPEDARFFEFDFVHRGSALGRVTVSISEDEGLVAVYSADITDSAQPSVKRVFYNMLKELREFAKQHLLTFDTRDITKSNLEKRDYSFLAATQFKESNMNESKLFGTSKTSYQTIGEARIVVKHSSPINVQHPAGRAQRIESIYIENAQGERFKYPYKHLNGARALAQHVSSGGNPYDSIGQHVVGLSEELSKLRMFKSYVKRNPMVSEAMDSITCKVSDRIEQVKESIARLQHPTHYAAFAESFVEPESKEIPESVVNDWIDRLTIRTFNEELKNVFPYIFKLVNEDDIPVKELDADDLIAETYSDEYENEKPIPEFEEYKLSIDRIAEESDLFGENNQELIDQLNSLVSDALPVGVDGTNAVESLKGIIDDPELDDIFKELADISPETDARPILKDYIGIKDRENGTSVLDSINFEGSSLSSVEEPEVSAEPSTNTEEPVEPSVGTGLELDTETPAGDEEPLLQPETEEPVTASYDRNQMYESYSEQREDLLSNRAEELIEFVKSMFNGEEGNFPKGEEGVLIACEKKFGDHVRPMAERVVTTLQQVSETVRMKRLAGIKEATFTKELKGKLGADCECSEETGSDCECKESPNQKAPRSSVKESRELDAMLRIAGLK